MTREVTLLYAHGEQIGYGRMGVMIAQELANLGVEIYDSDGHLGEALTPQGVLHGTAADPYRSKPEHTNLSCLMSVPSHFAGWYEGQHRACLTMWETKKLPESFRDTLHEFDTILVPSYQNLDLFSKYHDNVHFIPLGVDPELWHYIKPTPPDRYFDFMIAGRGDRKGVDLAYAAFREVFRGVGTPGSGMPIPRLKMKSLKGHGEFYGPNIEHITGMLDPLAERDLYASAHCYIQPSRGEGFGLQPLQAIALGRPTILTGAHGHESFAHLGIPIDSTDSEAAYFIYGNAGDWWEPDFEQICEAMWEVYNNWETAQAHAERSAWEVAQHWTWRNTAEQFIQLLGDEMGPYMGSGEFILPERKLYKITTRSDYKGEIAGRQLYFQTGVEYYDFADIKRILFDAGFLSNECLTLDDEGLAPVQLSEVPHVMASNEYCQTCSQKLNSGIKRSDVIFAELEAEAAAR
jgi:glycosyltransferase involved in cell wall biosynthesis